MSSKLCSAECAEEVVDGTVYPLDWQGYHSYTVESEDRRTVVQFRSDQSPLDDEILNLAKRIHPNLVPVMERLGSRRPLPVSSAEDGQDPWRWLLRDDTRR